MNSTKITFWVMVGLLAVPVLMRVLSSHVLVVVVR